MNVLVKSLEDKMNVLVKSIDEAYAELVKAGQRRKGEGSRGGKVIGHTKSGKPIYSIHTHSAHKKFDIQDHLDAARKHESLEFKDTDVDPGHHGYHAGEHARKALSLAKKTDPKRYKKWKEQGIKTSKKSFHYFE